MGYCPNTLSTLSQYLFPCLVESGTQICEGAHVRGLHSNPQLQNFEGCGAVAVLKSQARTIADTSQSACELAGALCSYKAVASQHQVGGLTDLGAGLEIHDELSKKCWRHVGAIVHLLVLKKWMLHEFSCT